MLAMHRGGGVVFNSGSVQAQVYGTMKVLFLDVQAGSDALPGLPVEARSQSSGQVCTPRWGSGLVHVTTLACHVAGASNALYCR